MSLQKSVDVTADDVGDLAKAASPDTRYAPTVHSHTPLAVGLGTLTSLADTHT